MQIHWFWQIPDDFLLQTCPDREVQSPYSPRGAVHLDGVLLRPLTKVLENGHGFTQGLAPFINMRGLQKLCKVSRTRAQSNKSILGEVGFAMTYPQNFGDLPTSWKNDHELKVKSA
jgi:hypothetical protein